MLSGMNRFHALFDLLNTPAFLAWLPAISQQLLSWEAQLSAEDRKRMGLLAHLPTIAASYEIQQSVKVSPVDAIDASQQERIETLLKKFSPWRKGPFEIHGVQIDTEWRSDWKWERLRPFLDDLSGRKVLDIGCGSGYHLWRMLGAGAECAIGVDPMPLFYQQFLAIQHFMPELAAYFLPLGVDDLPLEPLFDTVFAMGVLYHRRSPIDFLKQLHSLLKPGGQVVLETLIVTGDAQRVLVPGERYAGMRNVWFVPSAAALEVWMQRCGFREIKTVDIDQTSCDEQRATDWMTGQSLADFLDPVNPDLSREGHPAPLRAILTARA